MNMLPVGRWLQLVVLSLVMMLDVDAAMAQQLLPPETIYVYNRYQGEGAVGYPYNALTNINLYDSPHGAEVVATLAPGEPVDEIGTLAITTPRKFPVRILSTKVFHEVYDIGADTTSFNYLRLKKCGTYVVNPGDMIYLMMYCGEGYYMAWCNGYIISVGQFNLKGFPASSAPQTPYLGEYLSAEPVRCDYWQSLEKMNGQHGWAKGQRGMLQIDYGREWRNVR